MRGQSSNVGEKFTNKTKFGVLNSLWGLKKIHILSWGNRPTLVLFSFSRFGFRTDGRSGGRTCGCGCRARPPPWCGLPRRGARLPRPEALPAPGLRRPTRRGRALTSPQPPQPDSDSMRGEVLTGPPHPPRVPGSVLTFAFSPHLQDTELNRLACCCTFDQGQISFSFSGNVTCSETDLIKM